VEDSTWSNIRARDAAEAAEKYAERADHYSGECDEDGRDILVRTPDQTEDQAKLYRVDVDTSPTYTEHPADDDNGQLEEGA
jgi:hypothetical protein